MSLKDFAGESVTQITRIILWSCLIFAVLLVVCIFFTQPETVTKTLSEYIYYLLGIGAILVLILPYFTK